MVGACLLVLELRLKRLASLGNRPHVLGPLVSHLLAHNAALKAALAEGLKHDVLAVSGGVSMGDYDLVPGLLRELGAELFFEKVAMQPGKPTVFGRCGQAAGRIVQRWSPPSSLPKTKKLAPTLTTRSGRYFLPALACVRAARRPSS